MTTAPHEARQDGGGTLRVRVNVLGHFDVWHGERDLTPPRGQPADVVQLLALHDGVMHRDTLVAALWPDDAPWVGTQRLRNVLHRLRAHSGALVVRERRRDLIRYQPPVRIDLTEFLALSTKAIALAHTDPQATLEHGTHALMYYRGPLLLGQPFTEWAHAERTQAAERHLLLLQALAHASDQLGDPWAARLYRERGAFGETPATSTSD
jgi:DNA-binding SARP family transcriptional activator